MLRTLKSNVLMGVSKELQEKARERDANWDCSGQNGIIQLYSKCSSVCCIHVNGEIDE